MSKDKHLTVVPLERIESRILVIRGHKVILDADLAEFYDVPASRPNPGITIESGYRLLR